MKTRQAQNLDVYEVFLSNQKAMEEAAVSAGREIIAELNNHCRHMNDNEIINFAMGRAWHAGATWACKFLAAIEEDDCTRFQDALRNFMAANDKQ